MAQEGQIRKLLFACGCLIAVFLRFCNSQCCTSRSLPARRLAASAVAGLTPAGCVRSVRFIQKECTLFKFASFASVGAVYVLVPKPAGRVL